MADQAEKPPTFADWVESLMPQVNGLETSLGIPEGFFKSLLKEGDDWAFTIKVHTLVEIAIAHLINTSLNRPELEGIVEKLGLQGKTSKLAFIDALKLLDRRQQGFVEELAGLRNRLAHDITLVSATLEERVSSLDGNKATRLLMLPKQDKDGSLLEFVRAEPRFVIWVSALNLLSYVYNKKTQIELNRVLTPWLFGTERMGWADVIYGRGSALGGLLGGVTEQGKK